MKAVNEIKCDKCNTETVKEYKSVIAARVDLINITHCPNCGADTRYLYFDIHKVEE